MTIKDNNWSHSIVGLDVPHVARTNLLLCGWTESYNGVKKVGQLPQQHELHSEAHQEAQVVQEATERLSLIHI